MRKYTVLAVLTLQAGVTLGLSTSQAHARAHALKQIRVDKKAGMGEYETTGPVQFKAGEVIWTAAELNKQLASVLESEAETAARTRADAKRKADAEDLAQLHDKAQKWDDVQEELLALRRFLGDVEALPKELFEQVKAALEKKPAATPAPTPAPK